MNFFPDFIKVKIMDGDINKPVPCIAIMIKLFAKHKNDYYFIPHLSNQEGIIEVTKEWINKQIEDTRNFFIMDYSSNLDDCETKMEIKIIDKDEVNNAIEGRKLYKDFFNISEKDIEDLLKASNDKYFPIVKLVELKGKRKAEIALVTKRNKET